MQTCLNGLAGIGWKIAFHSAILFSIFSSAQTSVQAQDYQPYPEAQITVQEWQTYYEQVKALHGKSARLFNEDSLEVFEDPNTFTTYAFTQKDHPAHPAWITRQVVIVQDHVDVKQIGYFAGNETFFAQIFEQYLRVNAVMRASMEEELQQKLGARQEAINPTLNKTKNTPDDSSGTPQEGSAVPKITRAPEMGIEVKTDTTPAAKSGPVSEPNVTKPVALKSAVKAPEPKRIVVKSVGALASETSE